MKQIRLVIPMAGEGSRFRDAGYLKPKPFIEANGRMLIEIVLDNLISSKYELEIILIARGSHVEANTQETEKLLTRGNIKIKEISMLTAGSLSTVLHAQTEFDDDIPLLIANSDQFVDFNVDDFLEDAIERNLEGSILVFRDESRNPKWSFASLNADGLVAEVAEKIAISDLATVGIYYFSKGCDFVSYAKEMIAANDRVNNEFYTCPIYNYYLKDGAKIGVFEVPASSMFGLGIPDDLQAYLRENS